MESIKTAGSVLGTGFNAFISDWDKILAAAAGVSLLALGVYTAKGSTGVIARYVESRIGKPSLVRETSRVNLIDTVRHPIKTVKSIKVVTEHEIVLNTCNELLCLVRRNRKMPSLESFWSRNWKNASEILPSPRRIQSTTSKLRSRSLLEKELRI